MGFGVSRSMEVTGLNKAALSVAKRFEQFRGYGGKMIQLG
ncbi:predicted protein [Sclerotinia sclerotiorum 1980 UF-70]|uniref:Uncharacterized protein n=1 Tax=Sclerotinia sclerotiorum (strain ATCC 18683 / 1980 / Ss-1) TaxID=665079 RepID=A7F422_SCLS1|nr:predicted protein [Sclerotinia sclerotiorum 1980 UF-70]EDN97493.1 predicted protein [Sclerotinia sclerotiorum 1980 UF-70]